MGTSKKVEKILGNKVWIIAGIGKPREYYLCSWFVADGIDENEDDYFKNIVYGSERTSRAIIDPPIKLNDLPWFKEFLRTQANFSFGLRVIHPKFVSKFEGLIKGKRRRKESASGIPIIGDGSGGSLDKRLVEKRAIELVSKRYRSNGWIVKSVENERKGFDLLCRKGRLEEHVEVKGLSGFEKDFTLTANEYQYASSESRFRICIVTGVLTMSPKLHSHSFAELVSEFRIEPIAYRFRVKK
ncbi:MAG: DUF3883 domain-containing protein [Meiothermus sp.]|nr:DUF3883 domain-containing protein [Meiothermus sp.]